MLIASFSVSPEALALAETAEAIPEIDVEAERIAAHSMEWTMPCIWVSYSDFNAVDEQLRADSSVNEVVEGDHVDEEAYYQIDWSDEVKHRINPYLDKSGSLLEAHLTDGRWTIVLRFASRDQFDTLCDHLREQGRGFTLLGISEAETPRVGYRGLTPTQRDALVAAANQGYFRVPREVNIEGLAAELDTSHQALSEVLRRGMENLVFSTLTANDQQGE